MSILSSHQEREEDFKLQTSNLEQELARANELLISLKQRGPTHPPHTSGGEKEDILSLSPAATEISSFLRSGMTLTQIYSRYVQISEELHQEKTENNRLGNYLDQIMHELDEKTPALQQLRKDYNAGWLGIVRSYM